MPDDVVTVHRAVQRFLRSHPDLQSRWESIVDQIQQNPRTSRHIGHLKGQLFCSYRWDEGSYRIKYEVFDQDPGIYFYDANNRGDAYHGSGWAERRR